MKRVFTPSDDEESGSMMRVTLAAYCTQGLGGTGTLKLFSFSFPPPPPSPNNSTPYLIFCRRGSDCGLTWSKFTKEYPRFSDIYPSENVNLNGKVGPRSRRVLTLFLLVFCCLWPQRRGYSKTVVALEALCFSDNTLHDMTVSITVIPEDGVQLPK